MPNKTIYVSDSDLPLFEKAQELYGSNLSSTIVRVLRHAIDRGNKFDEDDAEGEFHDIIIEVGQSGCFIKQRFSGRLIAKWKTGSSEKIGRAVRLYETKNGRYALYSRARTNWENYDWSGWEYAKRNKRGKDAENAGAPGGAQKEPMEHGESKLEVFESFEAFRERIPENIRDIVEKKISGVAIEDLDI
jgi:EXLDI family protein